MKWSEAFIPTLKEEPAETETISHKLMVRAGLIRQLSAGTYSYLPLGTLVLNKVINIIREEMNRAGAQEILMPALQPPELWEKTRRLSLFGEIIYKFIDRTGKTYILGPTHEEVVTDIVANFVRSYRQMPLILYQIQTKFRDEIRPRFGVIRSKEFLMKDAYSFDIDQKSLNKSYLTMHQTYCRIFERCGLKYYVVEAESGLMGGDVSHEFMVPSASGEDLFIICNQCGYGANIIMSQAIAPPSLTSEVLKPLSEVKTPGKSSVEAVSKFLGVKPAQLVKTLICLANTQPIAILIRGDHELNITKLARVLGTTHITMADAMTIEKVTGGPMGFSGPVGLHNIRIIADNALRGMSNLVTGANKIDTHLVNVNLERDFTYTLMADIRYTVDGDLCPKCNQPLKISHGIEVGHIFKLGTRYSEPLKAYFQDLNGNYLPIVMGCYGIGINRIIAAVLENSYDQAGIIWPPSIAPYQVLILSVNPTQSKVYQVSENLYQQLCERQIEVLWDDRNLSAGIKFNDADLVGIPIRVTVGNQVVKNDLVDIKLRRETSSKSVPVSEAITYIVKLLESFHSH